MMILAFATFPIACSDANSSERFDFKGVFLGTSIDDFKKLPHPDLVNENTSASVKKSEVVCSGEKGPAIGDPREPYQVSIYDPDEKSAGIKKCIWVSNSSGYTGDIAPISIAGSGYGFYDYTFSFMPSTEEDDLVLYKFEGQTNNNAFDDTIDALTNKYGPPKKHKDTVRNGMGNEFTQITAIWDAGESVITVTNIWGSIDKMGLVMYDLKMQKQFQEIIEKRKSEIKNPI